MAAETKRFRFYDRQVDGDSRSYAVDTWPEGHPEKLVVLPGRVESVLVSNDDKIGRFRRPRKRITRWRAKVSPRAAALMPNARGGRELVLGFALDREPAPIRVDWSGEDFRTREAAAEALAYWHAHPDRREGPSR